MSIERDPIPTNAVGAVVANSALVEELYEKWSQDHESVAREWQVFFEGFEMASCPRTCVAADQAKAQSRVASLIYAYRSRGHLLAQLDPLGNNLASHPDLSLERFDFTERDLDRVFDTGHLGGPSRAPLGEIVGILQDTYCRSVGVEYIHIQDMEVRRWLQAQMEPILNRPDFSREDKLEFLRNLIDAELLETFTHSRYPGQKRFSIEGGEAAIVAIHTMVEMAPDLGIEEIVMGMAHRGRLNVLANILDKSYAEIFNEFEENFLPESVGGDGDVKYHIGYSYDHTGHNGKTVHISLTSNPSHLEAVDPVVLGRARAKQRQKGDTEQRKTVLPLLIHGDAAFSGQGLVAETLELSQLEGYRAGGTVHFIINNQIGFTTLPKEGRSTRYATDVAKMIEAPIFHVNGDDPEAVAYVAGLALRFRQHFGRDVVVDMICYRRHGHNEADEPAFTQPVLYKKIRNHPSVRKLYTQRLVENGDLSKQDAQEIADNFKSRLEEAFQTVKTTSLPHGLKAFDGQWKGLNNAYSHEPATTAVSQAVLEDAVRALTTIPDGFKLNPKVARHLPKFAESVKEHGTLDWASAELLAFGSLLHEGLPVRLSGQDSARGTFSQRHSVWTDMNTQESYIPLNHIHEKQARFCVYNSMLSEAGVLGFDYGYSLNEPDMLVIWEAQFGDFSNGAQVIVDQFVVSSMSKWARTSGLVMLLPHGLEGQGPEHSNAYMERYLAACAEDNIQVCNLTTPAQYFHALRRQLKRNFRRPLVIMSPKSLLRHPMAASSVDDLTQGGFQEILDDSQAPEKVRRLVLCSGKVFYDLAQARDREKVDDVALVRIEQLYPFHGARMAEIAARYKDAQEVAWVQEETQNRGGWSFMFPRLLELFPPDRVRYVGRKPASSPAPGSLHQYKVEQEKLVREALA
ncbi:MAG: 2-oxoglutarate dehydrogenase E1 component [Acidobacteriota bacterium]